MATEAGRVRAPGIGWLGWLVLAAAWFATLQARPMLDPDEGRYAEIPREMLASGDWLTPRLDGLKYFEKPPLQYWATAAAYAVFGLSEWTSRLWTVGLGFACLPMVFGWTRRLYGTDAALAAVVALAASPYFGVIAHLNLLDAGFTFWLTGAVFAFTLAQSSEEGGQAERRWMLLAWLAAALAILSKGIVVGVLTGVSLIVYSLIERDVRPWRRLHVAWGLPLFLLVAAPWFIAVSVRNPDFPGFFFIHEHFTRFLTTVHQRVEPWWFFLPLLLFGVLPWIFVVAGACRRAWRDRGPTPQFKPLRFLLIFAAVALLFFSASGSKLAPYILPMFPPLAAIVGAHVSARPVDGERRTFLLRMAIILAVIGVIVAVGGVIYSVLHNSFVPHLAMLWLVGGVAAMLIAMVTVRAGTRRSAPGRSKGQVPIVALAAASTLAWQCFLAAYAAIPPLRSARDLVEAARPFIRPQTALYSVGQYRETISPYLQRTLTVVQFRGELEFGLHAEPGRQEATAAEFVARWNASTDAVAFFGPQVWDEYRRRGLPGRVIAADHYTVAVSRS
jgi:4-amino-4-deoxy-L-arabinose transferase-like glycosyltransferase